MTKRIYDGDTENGDNPMQMNENSIRIREIKESDLEWSAYVDVEKQDLEVPCFDGTKKRKYTGFLKPSLDLLYFRRLCEARAGASGEKHIFKRSDVEYTDAFIVLNMDDSPKKNANAGYLYWYGVYQRNDWDEYVKYVEYKRSGNAAKKGKHIFIREDFYADMMRWSWLGWNPKDARVSIPYVEMKAYEALVNSTIKDTVRIDPDEILLLDDVRHPFKARISKVRQKQENRMELVVDRCEDTVVNNVFDGECLLDRSVFEAGEMDAGMMLLRSFFFKSCGFCTDIQGYYRESFGPDYENAKVQDRFGNWIAVSKVRMIVTESSFKLFKFSKYFAALELNEGNGKASPDMQQLEELDLYFDEEEQESFAYDRWRNKVKENGCVFGVVKNEERHSETRKFTYQMLNSMHFSKEDIDVLMAKDVEKLVELRTDYDAYEAYIGKGEHLSYSEQFIREMVRRAPVFRQTKLYKEKRNNDIRAFKQKLYEGKLNIEADYYTLCSMPWELLQYSVKGEAAFADPVLKSGEISVAGFAEGERVTLCRNPHICASNVICAVNRRIPELEKWFHFKRKDGYSNIIVLSPWEWDVMEALNGADFDSDEVLCIRDPIVLKRAEELQENPQITAVPHPQIASDRRGAIETENFAGQYEADKALSGNKIGVISNYAQILNGYYWDSFQEGSRFAGRRDELYDDIQILSVLAGIEIDKAKHSYSIDAGKAASAIMDKYSEAGGGGRKRRNRPVFMCFIDKDRHGEAVRKAKEDGWLDCPMDHVAKKLYYIYKTDERLKEQKQVPTIDLEDLFEVDDYKGYDGNRVETVLDKLDDCIRQLKKLNINKANLEWVENDTLKRSILDETYQLMDRNKISILEMKRILYLVLEKELTEKMRQKKTGKAFYACLLVNNREAVSGITGTAEKTDVSQKEIYENSTEYIKASKKSGKKTQINYVKCRKIFRQFLETDGAGSIENEKNDLNIAYMLQVISEKRSHCPVKNDKLMALSVIYHVWPELFMDCIRDAAV